MKRTMLQTLVFFKGLVLLLRPGYFLGYLRNPMLAAANVIGLSKWISMQEREGILNDFYFSRRDYSKRYRLYEFVVDKLQLRQEALNYLEFGVCEANSLKWWMANSSHTGSTFYGFDTFEGLPEAWGSYNKGEMAAGIPQLEDTRVKFIKGLFQETIPGFILRHDLKNNKRKIVHFDADLFSSTLYVLTSLAPYFKKGDILLFDEFNVPNHEYFAFQVFSDAYYIKTRLLGAVNNFYQVALIIE